MIISPIVIIIIKTICYAFGMQKRLNKKEKGQKDFFSKILLKKERKKHRRFLFLDWIESETGLGLFSFPTHSNSTQVFSFSVRRFFSSCFAIPTRIKSAHATIQHCGLCRYTYVTLVYHILLRPYCSTKKIYIKITSGKYFKKKAPKR